MEGPLVPGKGDTVYNRDSRADKTSQAQGPVSMLLSLRRAWKAGFNAKPSGGEVGGKGLSRLEVCQQARATAGKERGRKKNARREEYKRSGRLRMLLPIRQA